MEGIDTEQTVAIPLVAMEYGERPRFRKKSVAPEERHEGVADRGVNSEGPHLRAAMDGMERIRDEHAVASAAVQIEHRRGPRFGIERVAPAERHERIADGGVDGECLQFGTRRAVMHNEMERFAHGAAIAFRFDINAIRCDAETVPSFVGQLDGVEREVRTQSDIRPAITIERQAVRRILPEVVIGGFETAVSSNRCLENIR